MTLWIAGLSFVSIFFLIIALSVLVGFVKHPVDDRLQRYTSVRRVSNSVVYEPSVPSRSWVQSIGKKLAPKDPQQRSEAQQRLSMAGYYGDRALFTYWGCKSTLVFIVPAAICLLYIIYEKPLLEAAIPLFFALGLGLFIPDIVLYFQIKKRQKQIFQGLPDVLDLLVVCLEAGLGLDAAMQKVSEEFHLTSRVLSQELNLACAAIRMGQSRSEALHEMGSRTGNIDLKTLVAVLNQADRFGTSTGQALRVHADDMRVRRRYKAEEMAAKTTVKLIFPLVLFIFPAIFVVLGGPAIIRIVCMFTNNTL